MLISYQEERQRPLYMLIARAHHRLDTTTEAFQNAFPAQKVTPYAISTTTPTPIKPLPSGGHIILTSPAAVATAQKIHADKPIHCVGPATAEAAQQAGLNNIGYIGASDGEALAQIILENLTPPEVFHHLTTHEGKTNWYKPLTKAGHAVQRHIAYTTHYTEKLTKEAVAAINAHQPIAVFSPKSAKHLIFLTNSAKLPIHECIAHCFSPAIAQICIPHFKHVKIAKTPTLSALMETL